MDNFERIRHELLDVVNLAIEGQLSLEDFYKRWPQSPSDSDAVTAIYADVEDGVEHFPAKLFSGEPDWKMWKGSRMYALLCLDRELLRVDASERVIHTARDELGGSPKIDIDALGDTVRRFVETLGEQ